MEKYQSSQAYGGREEYDSELAKQPDCDHSFVETLEDLLYDGDQGIDRSLHYLVSSAGVEVSAQMDCFTVPRDGLYEFDKTHISLEYDKLKDGPEDKQYYIQIQTLPQKDTLVMSDALKTNYSVSCYNQGESYIGWVEGFDASVKNRWSGREMTPYDYRALNRILMLARTVQLAQQRERAILPR